MNVVSKKIGSIGPTQFHILSILPLICEGITYLASAAQLLCNQAESRPANNVCWS